MIEILSKDELKQLNEAVSIGHKNLNKYLQYVKNYFTTKLGKIYHWKTFDMFNKKGYKHTLMGMRYFLEDMRSFRINWKVELEGSNLEGSDYKQILNFALDSVDFWEAQKSSPSITLNIDYIEDQMTSIASVLPIIYEILNGDKYTTFNGKEWKLDVDSIVDIPTGVEISSSMVEGFNFKLYETENDDLDFEDNELNEGRPRKNPLPVVEEPIEETPTKTTRARVKGTKNIEEKEPKTPKARVSRAKKEEDVSKETKTAQKKLDEVKYADPKTIFEDLDNYVDMVIKGIQVSLLVCGLPGVGKTFNITNKMNDDGLKEIDHTKVSEMLSTIKNDPDGRDEIDSYIESAGDWVHIKGSSTAYGMFKVLFLYRNKIIVFDDCDSVFGDKDAVNILKGALDSYDVRKITWQSEKTLKGLVPGSFQFNGKIIFVSNIHMSKLDKAIRSRSFTVDITLKAEDVILRMETIINEICPEYNLEIKKDSLDALKDAYKKDEDKIELNMRSWIKAMKIRQMKAPRWKEMIQYQCATA